MADTTLSATGIEVDNLIIEAGEVVKRTILTDQVLTRGTLLTYTTGKMAKTLVDGQIDAIVKDDIDTTGADAVANVYYTGVYNLGVVETETGITVTEAMQDSARVNGIMVGTR